MNNCFDVSDYIGTPRFHWILAWIILFCSQTTIITYLSVLILKGSHAIADGHQNIMNT